MVEADPLAQVLFRQKSAEGNKARRLGAGGTLSCCRSALEFFCFLAKDVDVCCWVV